MRRRGERILGPYEQHNGWRVVEVDATGKRGSTIFETEEKARRYMALIEAELERVDHTTATALVEYRAHLTKKGTLDRSIDVTERAVKMFFPEAVSLAHLSAKRAAAAYEALQARPTALTGKPPAADTHRNALVQTRSFLKWCVKQKWLRENPLADVEGVGKRRKRGKSLGKSGTELRIKEARAWYDAALVLAAKGDQGATAALVALLLGMRASEIVGRRVRDLDETEVPGDTLWIPCSKTAAGRRTLEVPPVLRPLLVALCDGRDRENYVFARKDGGARCRDWIIANVRRICDAAQVPRVTAHAMRGLLATITADRGMAGHLIAATLGHASEVVTMTAYAAPGAARAGVNRRGLQVLEGGVSRGA